MARPERGDYLIDFKRATARVLSVAAVVAVAGAVAAAPAQAALSANAPGGIGYGSVRADTWYVSACDTKADNRGIRLEYVYADGRTDHVGDANGSSGGCGGESVPRIGSLPGAYSFRVCAANPDSCTAWQSVG